MSHTYVTYSLRIWHPKIDGGWPVRESAVKSEITNAAEVFSEAGFQVQVYEHKAVSTPKTERVIGSTLNKGGVYYEDKGD